MEYILLMAFSCSLTVLIECGFAALLFKKRTANEQLVVASAQILTNPVVEGVCGIIVPLLLTTADVDMITYDVVTYSVLAIFEIAAFVVEGVIYKKFNFERPFLMSAVLNLLSYGTGVLVSLFLFA